MASRPKRDPIPSASKLSRHEDKQTSSSSSSTTRHPIRPASNLSQHKDKRTTSSCSSPSPATCLPPPSSTARHPNRPAANLSHHKGERTSSSSAATRHPPPPSSTARHPIRLAWNLSRRKDIRTSSSSTATRPPPPFSSSTPRHPIPPASNLSHHKGERTFSSSTARPPITPALNLSHHKDRACSSSFTATCPPTALPTYSFVEHPEIKHDLFISFRGPDVRSTFLSHLCGALDREKIDYFVDDKNIKDGDEISTTLLNAIKKSEISLVLFSEDYASSEWCLEELQQIMECMENQKQIILPVFYKVKPSTVRHQKGKYYKAFVEHGKTYDENRLQKWKAALKRASDLSGFESSKYSTEETLIKEIVERVLVEFRKRENQNDLKGFVGIQKHIQYLETRLRTDSQDILTIGIWGMAGVGKTTITDILYNRLGDKFEGKHLLCVREELANGKSIRDLKKDLISKLLGDVVHDVTINGSLEYVERRLIRKKVLVVLDDVHDLDHLEILIGKHVWFGPGSRIIITTRDKHVFSKGCDEIYVIKPLNSEDALQLFEKCFEKISIEEQELKELSEWVMNYAKGVPLVIKVLCGYLFGAESKVVRDSKLEKLKTILDSKIQNVLELSYYELDDEHRDIFLYIACFFKRESRMRIISLLDECGYHTIDGLRVLQDKALITISNFGVVSMHDLIQAMGFEIVRKVSLKDFAQRSHLWDVQNIQSIFENQMGNRSIKSIRLDIWRLKKDLQLRPQSFDGIDNLRLLQFDSDSLSENKCRVYPPNEGFESLPNGVRCFIWTGYPLKSFTSKFCEENLVELRFKDSKLQRLWNGVLELPNLKVFDLSWSHELIELPYLSNAPKLDHLLLLFCNKLSHVRLWPEPDSIGCWTSLSINPSSKYYVFPCLKVLQLNGCLRVAELPDNIGICFPSLQKLSLYETKLVTLPASIKHLSKLKSLYLLTCELLRYTPELPPSIESFEARNCTSLEMLRFTSNSMPLSQQKYKVYIALINCVKLDDHQLEAVAKHYKLTTQRIISASIQEGSAILYIPRSKIPKCLSTYRATQGLVSVPLELPLHSNAMGFIFYFVLLQGLSKSCSNCFPVKCHIELSNVSEVRFTFYLTIDLWGHSVDRVVFAYDTYSSLQIKEEVSRIKASATRDVQYAKVWFEVSENMYNWFNIKKWGVYPIFIPSEPQDLANSERYPDINDNDDEV